ncbi:GTPase [Paraburkholderia hospita]
MPANLSPEYKQAEQAYRAAREPREQLECLKEMLRTIPKHKGTERLQADIKSRMRELTQGSVGHGKAAHRGPSHAVHADGAAQLCLIGPPGAGKSSLHARLTGSNSEFGPYHRPTRLPIRGMLPFEDISFQLVDLSPVSAEFMRPELTSILRSTDGALLVVDLSAPDCIEQLALILKRLVAAKIIPTERWPGQGSDRAGTAVLSPADPFSVYLPTLLLANKTDLANPEDAPCSKTCSAYTFRCSQPRPPADEDWPRSDHFFSELWALCASTPRPLGNPSTGIGPLRCVAATPCWMSPCGCILMSHARSGSPAFGGAGSSAANRWAPIIRWPIQTSWNCIRSSSGDGCSK